MTETVRAQGAIPLALGGDHYNSYPACLGYARGLAKRHPGRRFGYIQIDGHLDFADRLGAWGTHNHATNGRRNSELPNIERSNMVWIGITGWVDGDELSLIEEMGGKIFSSGDVHALGAEEVARRAVAHATRGRESLYLSIDIDAMDAGFLPGTGSIVPSGITPRQYCQILDVIAQENVDGIDIAEVAPSLDPSGRTERIAAQMLYRVVRNRFLVPETVNNR
jgi:agmatinase